MLQNLSVNFIYVFFLIVFSIANYYTEADGNDITECAHDDTARTGMFAVSGDIFSAVIVFAGFAGSCSELKIVADSSDITVRN